MGSTRIKANKLMLQLGADDYWADCISVRMDNEEADSDVTTFEDAAKPGGAVQDFFEITAVQSTDPDSLWSHVWDNTGQEIPFVYAPHANADPTPAQPHFTGTLKIGPRPAIGGEASRTAEYTFETRWNVVGEPVKDDGN